MPHHVTELDSGSRHSPLPELGADLPGLRSNVPGLRLDLPGSSAPLSAPLSGQHVPPLRGKAGLLPRGQDGRRLEKKKIGHNTGVQQDALAPYSITSAHKTAPALAPRASRNDPLVARPARLVHSRARTAAPASETAEQAFSSGLRRPQDGQNFGSRPCAGGLPDAFAPHFTTAAHKTTPALDPRAARSGLLDAWPAGFRHSRARVAVSASKPTEQDSFSGFGRPQDGQPFENSLSGLDAGGLLDNFDPPSAAASRSGRGL